MDLHSDIRRRKAGDLRDRRRIHLLQIRNHDLPVQRLELPYESRELLQRPLLIDVRPATRPLSPPPPLPSSRSPHSSDAPDSRTIRPCCVPRGRSTSSASTVRRKPRNFATAEGVCPAAGRGAVPRRLRIRLPPGRARGQIPESRRRTIPPAPASPLLEVRLTL